MSVVTRDARRRWSVVGAAVLALALTPPAIAAWPADAGQRDLGTLRTSIQRAATVPQPFQGLAESSGGVSLPDLPQFSSIGEVLDRTNRLRVWWQSRTAWRVARLDATGEQDSYGTLTGTELWSFEDNRFTTVVGEPPVRLPWASDLTPPELTRRLLTLAGTGDTLSALPGRRVAGVVAAGLRITPRDKNTTIGHLDVWADPRSGLPVQVELTGRGASRPLVGSRFLELQQQPPPGAVLVPQAPRSASFERTTRPDVVSAINQYVTLALPDALAGVARRDAGAGLSDAGLSGVAVYGRGWSSIVVIGVPGRDGARIADAAAAAGTVLDTKGAQSVLLSGSALNVLVVRPDSQRRRTYLLAGAASADLLRRAGAELVTTTDPS